MIGKQLKYFYTLCVVISLVNCAGKAEKKDFIKNEGRDAVIAAGGDLVCGSYVENAVRKYGIEHPFKEIRSHIEKADIFFVNLECAISEKGERRQKAKSYGASRIMLDSIVYSGIDIFSINNNHVGDMGQTGLVEMINLLDDSPVFHGGAGKDKDAASAPFFVNVNGLKIAILFYNSTSSQLCAEKTGAGYNCLDYTKPDKWLKKLENDIGKIKNADLKIISFHWGPNYTTNPNDGQIKFAHTAIDNGADIILGHSSHIFHGIEIYKNRPILYDMGDFLINDDDDWDSRSFIYYINIKEGRIDSLELLPVYMPNSQIRPAPEILAEEINTRFMKLSEKFSTQIENSNGRLIIKVLNNGI